MDVVIRSINDLEGANNAWVRAAIVNALIADEKIIKDGQVIHVPYGNTITLAGLNLVQRQSQKHNNKRSYVFVSTDVNKRKAKGAFGEVYFDEGTVAIQPNSNELIIHKRALGQEKKIIKIMTQFPNGLNLQQELAGQHLKATMNDGRNIQSTCFIVMKKMPGKSMYDYYQNELTTESLHNRICLWIAILKAYKTQLIAANLYHLDI